MLKRLQIKNIVLVENCTVYFQSGLNVLTGETGAGKSVILSSLSLLLGERADTSLIRQGSENGSVEASFEIDSLSHVVSLLDTAGIEHSSGDELIIRRELSLNGKSRILINNQAAQLAFVKKLAPHIIESCGQHAHMRLVEKDFPLETLDTWAGLTTTRLQFQKAYHEEMRLRNEINHIIASESEQIRKIENLKREIEEIDNAELQEGEDEEIYQVFSELEKQSELIDLIRGVSEAIDGDKQSILSQLTKQRNSIDKLSKASSKLSEIAQLFDSGLEALKEVSFQIEQFRSQVEHSPIELAKVEARMQILHDLKRKYGQTVEEILLYRKKQKETLADLENQDSKLEVLKAELEVKARNTNELAKTLSEKRRACSPLLQAFITKEIQTLNMPHAEFEIEIIQTPRSAHGDEDIQYYMTPNLGEKKINIQENASGGELARLTLALQTALIGKHTVPTILFDEVDANIGGETARIVGKKLQAMGKTRQVLCVTHFPQVAIFADNHFKIYKTQKDNRTISTIIPLSTDDEKSAEIQRMLGGQSLESIKKKSSKTQAKKEELHSGALL